MSKAADRYLDYVLSLSSEEFSNLKEAVNIRIDRDEYGITSFEEAAIKYGRKPICPKQNNTAQTVQIQY